MKAKKIIWEALAFAASAAFFWFVLNRFGISEITAVLGKAGWTGFGACLFYPLMCAWDVAAWKALFYNEDSARVRFKPLFLIRLAGEAVNNVTPFLDVGGEPLKVFLTSKKFGIPLSRATVSTLAAKTAIFIAEALFMIFGALGSYWLLPMQARSRTEIGALLLLICFIFSAFLYLQVKGVFYRLNPEISRFYSSQRPRFLRAIVLNAAGWVMGGVETYFFCRASGLPLNLLEAVVLEALLQLVRTGSFFIPMNLGVQEGGMAFFVGLWGYDPVLGIGISLLKRVRQLLWTGMGFAVWAFFQYQEAKKKVVVLTSSELLSVDTELDKRIHRPAAQILASLLAKTPYTPNQITLLGLLPALLSGVFSALGDVQFLVLGFLFFYLWSVMDHVDGSLARLKKMTSEKGMILDDVCDIIGSTLILCGLFLGLVGLWGETDRHLLAGWFYTGVVLNALFGFLLMLAKRRARQEAVYCQKTSQGFIWKQRWLDKIGGRDSFYFLYAAVMIGQVAGKIQWGWYSLTMGFLIVSLYTAFLVALVECISFWRRRAK